MSIHVHTLYSLIATVYFLKILYHACIQAVTRLSPTMHVRLFIIQSVNELLGVYFVEDKPENHLNDGKCDPVSALTESFDNYWQKC